MVSIFRLGRCGKVGLSLGPNRARSEIYSSGNLDISTLIQAYHTYHEDPPVTFPVDSP